MGAIFGMGDDGFDGWNWGEGWQSGFIVMRRIRRLAVILDTGRELIAAYPMYAEEFMTASVMGALFRRISPTLGIAHSQ
jgi:hypothetical protein